MKKLAIFGGIGAASTIAGAVCDAVARGYREYEFVGYINDKDNLERIEGYPIVGGLKDVPQLLEKGYHFINTIYKVDGQVERVRLFENLHIPHERLATFIHPLSFVSPTVDLSPGCVVMPFAMISTGVHLGICCRVMSGAMIGHDCSVDNHSFFAARSCLGSHIDVGSAAYFGLNCTIGGKLKIGEYSVIGMGAVVTRDVGPFEIWTGNPAKMLRKTKDIPEHGKPEL